MEPLRLQPVQPTGARQVSQASFVCTRSGSDHLKRLPDEKVYPPSPEGVAFRELRVRLNLGLREAARHLELKASDLSAVETGEQVFTSPAEWGRARGLLVALAASRGIVAPETAARSE